MAAAIETPSSQQPREPSPFHEGEQRIQTALGVRDEIEPWARRVVRPYLPEEHREFYAQLPYLVAAGRDAAGRPWATLLAGEPGFATSPDPRTLRLAVRPVPGDALDESLAPGADLGLLGIELHTRRRNRVNGRVAEGDADELVLAVDQSFGNCPQYITERRWQRAPAGNAPGSAARGPKLSHAQQERIRRADTFFIATGYREADGDSGSETFGMDASHRGGAPGFVRVDGERQLVFPDYAGNNHFNTLGNLLLDPRAGLLFVDFERGDLLQLTGRATIDCDSPEIEQFEGARRLIRFEVDEVVELEHALPLRWQTASDAVRELRVIAKRTESADVTSFVLSPDDGRALDGFTAGQHLPIELDVAGAAEPVRRTYSLSSAPDDAHYRISVKREPLGLASRHLHDELAVGDTLRASAPQGTFRLDLSGSRPIVLVSAGVGFTPLLSMLHALAAEDAERPVWFVHGARDGEHHPLRLEVQRLIESRPGLQQHIAYSCPSAGDASAQRYDQRGRVDGALLEKLVPELDADFYLCGPIGFMAAIQGQLEARGVATERIHSESFGAAGKPR
jgi:ferredoxin-NADP reductase